MPGERARLSPAGPRAWRAPDRGALAQPASPPVHPWDPLECTMTEIEGRSRLQDRRALGRWIRESRQQRGWNQHELAEKFGVTQSMISALERSKYSLEYTKWIGLCAIFGVSVTDASAAIAALATAPPPDAGQKQRIRKRTAERTP